MLRRLLLILSLFAATPALAGGFMVSDTAGLVREVRAGIGADFDKYNITIRPNKFMFSCENCPGSPTFDMRLDRTFDGTEERFRSGQTTIEQMQARCRLSNASCSLTRIAIGRAVGWRTRWQTRFQGQIINVDSLLLMKDGSTLTIRSVAGTPEFASQNLDRLMTLVVPRIVGN